MRDQYKVLAEKYHLIKEYYSLSLDSAIADNLNLDKDSAKAFIDWIDKVHRKELGFEETDETPDEIFVQYVMSKGETDGLTDDSLQFYSDDDANETKAIIIKSWYRDYLKYYLKPAKKAIAKRNKQIGINLDI